jgi:predicted transposase YdaD
LAIAPRAFDNLCKLLSETYPDPFPEHLLQRVATQVQRLDDRQRRQVSNYTQILAGLKYQKALIQQLFQEGMMRESVIYQEILEEGRQEGRQEGSQSLLLRLLTRRLGPLPGSLQSQVASLPLPQLEALGEALLEFQAIADLETWLQANL